MKAGVEADSQVEAVQKAKGLEGWKEKGAEGWKEKGPDGWKEKGPEGWKEKGVEGKGPGHPAVKQVPFVVVDGVRIPKIFESNRPMGEHIKCIHDLEMREDDILLCTFSKSGTHWLWEVISMLVKGKAEYESRIMEQLMLEAVPIEHTQAESSPRILNTHLHGFMLPKQTVSKKVKVIHVYRNPKDVIVSMYFHLKKIPGLGDIDLHKTANLFYFSPDLPQSGYIGYMKSMAAFRNENPEVPALCIAFEEMKKDSVSVVSKLASFLKGLTVSEQLVKDIATACSFQKLKEASTKKHLPDHFHKGQLNMYRKGEVGDWKNYLTVALSEHVDETLKELSDLGYNIQYTI